MPERWSRDEEKLLLQEIKEGKTFSEISKIHDRTPTGLELRFKKIIYENVQKGKNISELAKKLNMKEDKLNQYYYEYKGFAEKKTANTTNSVNSVNSVKPTVNIDANTHTNTQEVTHTGGSLEDDKIKKIHRENLIMKEILNNIAMKKKIIELVKKGLLNKRVLELFKN